MRESTLEEDILPVMSALPLGGISLTFNICWTAASLFHPLLCFLIYYSPFLPFYPLASQLSVFALCEFHTVIFAASAVVAV